MYLERSFVMLEQGQLLLLSISRQMVVAKGNLLFSRVKMRACLAKIALKKRCLLLCKKSGLLECRRKKKLSGGGKKAQYLGLVPSALFVTKLL